jgi:predicted ester cyclase
LYLLLSLERRWIFHTAAIVTAITTILILGMRESRPSKLLRKKIDMLESEYPGVQLKFHSADPFPDLESFIYTVIIRPSKMMVTEPILIIVSILSGISWGIVYLFSESITRAYVTLGLSRTSATFPLLALVIGIIIGVFPHIWDVRKIREKKRQNMQIQPEDTIMGFAFGTPALAAGLWWFYGTTPPVLWDAHWAIPTGGLVLVGLGVNEIAYTLSGYLTDTYTVYSASAFAGLAFVRALVSGIMPLIGYVLFDGKQSMVPGFVIAGVATAFCVVPFLFFRFGKRLRERSEFAKYSLEVQM